jgi:hypothetical protein
VEEAVETEEVVAEDAALQTVAVDAVEEAATLEQERLSSIKDSALP